MFGWLGGCDVDRGTRRRSALASRNSGGIRSRHEHRRETLPALPLVYAAYAFVWVVLIAYVFMLWRRIGRVERELAGRDGQTGGPEMTDARRRA